MERVARRKLGAVPEGFEFFSWRVIGETDASEFRGGVPRILKSGPRKGEKTWKGSVVHTAIVTEAEGRAEQIRWVAETGSCGECLGSGERFKSWSVTEGTKHAPCRDCDGTGKAQAASLEVTGA